MTAEANKADREIVFKRAFDAPRELVWTAWTKPDRIARWWGPHGFTTSIYEMDVRPCGEWRFTMHGPDGVDYRNRVVYIEIAKPNLLVYSHGGEDGDEDEPAPFEVTVEFVEREGKTEMTMCMLFATAAERDLTVEFGAIELVEQTLTRLAEHLARA